MYLELINKLLNDWDDPNYKGLDAHIYEPDIKDITNNKIIKDIEELRYTKPNSKHIDNYKENELQKYYDDYNFSQNGYTIDNVPKIPTDIIMDIITANTQYILEIGFDSGFITSLFLQNSDAHITSIGFMNRLYTWYGKLFIDYLYKNKHTFIMSTINNIVPLGRSIIKYDVIWIEGTYPKLYDTLLRLRDYSNPNTTIIVNSICPHIKLYPYVTLVKLMKDNIISIEKHIKVGKNYSNGLAIIKYNGTTNLDIIKSIESNIPLEEFRNYILYKIDDAGYSVSTIKHYLLLLNSANINIDKGLLKILKEKFNIE